MGFRFLASSIKSELQPKPTHLVFVTMGGSLTKSGFVRECMRKTDDKPPDKTPDNGSSKVVIREQDMSDDHFSQHQKNILRETWTIINSRDHGVEIFTLIFERKPSAKKLFPFRDLQGKDLLENPLFRAHAARFMSAISSIIENLDALDVAFIPTLNRLGAVHGWIVGFEEEYLNVFIASIIHVIIKYIGEKNSEEVEETWTHLGQFLKDKLMEGYTQSAKAKATSEKITEHISETF